MAESGLGWSSNANEAFNISLVSPSQNGVKTIATFHPEFTYPIFGEDESIYGYQGLKLNLQFNASDMRPHFGARWSKQLQAVGDTEAVDVKAAIQDFLPPVAFATQKDFETVIRQTAASFTPPGERVASFESSGSQYEIWTGNLADLAVQQLVKRIQILVSLFIEAGTPIRLESEDGIEADPLDRWSIFILYQKKVTPEGSSESSYVFAGYSTVYRFWLYQPPTPPASPSKSGALELPKEPLPFSEFTCRSRISQFIILPPFQKKGNGARVYDTIFKHLLDDPKTIEITVEAPSEAFDLLRDLSDLEFLRAQSDFQAIRLNKVVKVAKAATVPKDILDKPALEALRLKTKIAPRQFYRLVEMQLMSKLPDSVKISLEDIANPKKPTKEEEYEYTLWKLVAKSRLYQHNRDALGQLEAKERFQALNDTLVGVELEYAKILAKFEDQSKKAGSIGLGKRKLDDGTSDEPASKKQRIVIA